MKEGKRNIGFLCVYICEVVNYILLDLSYKPWFSLFDKLFTINA